MSTAWLRRTICRFSGHRLVGSQSCPYLNGGVPTHCARCDWTQGPWEFPDLAHGLSRSESRTKGQRRLIRRMEKYGGKGFRILRSAETTPKRYRRPTP